MARHIPRIYCQNLSGQTFEIPDFQRQHLISVLRLKEGSQFLAFNSKDGEWLCKIENIKKSSIKARKIEIKRQFKKAPNLALAICIIKPDNMKLVIEKGTELGVTDFYLIRSEYTNAICNEEKLKAIAILASEQSERLDIPIIHSENSLKNFIDALPPHFKWFSAIERMKDPAELSDMKQETGFIIGPEGGFSENEKELLKAKTTQILLSKNILRSETAAIVCLAAYNFLLAK